MSKIKPKHSTKKGCFFVHKTDEKSTKRVAVNISKVWKKHEISRQISNVKKDFRKQNTINGRI